MYTAPWTVGSRRDEPLLSLHLSGNACQDCAKRKLEENGIEVAKKLRQSGTGLGLFLRGDCGRSARFVGGSGHGALFACLGSWWKVWFAHHANCPEVPASGTFCVS